MSRQIKPYIDRLKETLRQKNLYDPALDSSIRDIALLEVIRDNYVESTKEYGPIIRTTGCKGQMKIEPNKIYEELRKVVANIIYGKAKLGLCNVSTIQEDTDTKLDQFIKSLQQ